MAIFKAAHILNPPERKEVIVLSCFEIPEDEPIPTVSISFMPKDKKVQQRAKKRNTKVILSYNQETGRDEAEPSIDHLPYVQSIMKSSYLGSDELIDDDSLDVFLALLEEEPNLTYFLSVKITELYEHDEIYTQTKRDEDKKK